MISCSPSVLFMLLETLTKHMCAAIVGGLETFTFLVSNLQNVSVNQSFAVTPSPSPRPVRLLQCRLSTPQAHIECTQGSSCLGHPHELGANSAVRRH